MWEILIDFFIKALEHLLPVTLRHAYPPTRIQDKIIVQISPEGSGIEFWNGELPQVRAWIEIINLSQFPLELDRAYGGVEYGPKLQDFKYIRKTKIAPSSSCSIYVEISLTKEHAEVIQRLTSSKPNPVLTFNAYILCKIHNFEITRRIQTSHYRLANFDVPN